MIELGSTLERKSACASRHDLDPAQRKSLQEKGSSIEHSRLFVREALRPGWLYSSGSLPGKRSSTGFKIVVPMCSCTAGSSVDTMPGTWSRFHSSFTSTAQVSPSTPTYASDSSATVLDIFEPASAAISMRSMLPSPIAFLVKTSLSLTLKTAREHAVTRWETKTLAGGTQGECSEVRTKLFCDEVVQFPSPL